MQHKILEIIEFLLTEMGGSPNSHLSDLEIISEKLLNKGYSEKDIKQAVEWLEAFFDRRQAVISELRDGDRDRTVIRVLNSFEKKFFSSEAYGYILELQNMEIVSPLHLEQIIDRCLMLGLEQVELPEIKSIAAQVLLGTETNVNSSDARFYAGNETVH